MPDISMCLNDSCVLSNTCYRFKAKPNTIQSYSEFKPKDNVCDYYILNKEG